MRRPVLVIALLGVISAALAPWPASGATPDAGTVSPRSPSVTWAGPTWAAGANAGLHLQPEPVCPPREADPASQVCDHYTLTVDVPASYWKKNPGGVQITASWENPNNKIEVAVYDQDGNFVDYGLSGGRSSVVIAEASGTYDVIVEPTIVVRPTTYTGVAKIVSLPPREANPSLGHPSAYTATPVAQEDPDRPPRNPLARYDGAPVVLQAHPVGQLSYEPTIGIDGEGVVFIETNEPVVHPVAGNISSPRMRRSSDRGKTWEDAGTAEANQLHVSSCDPYTYVEPETGRLFWVDLQCTGIPVGTLLSFSDDRGATWTHVPAAIPGVNDHQTIIAADPPAGSGLVPLDPAFPKVLYYCANQITGVGCARSLDGGRTFARVGEPLFVEQTLGCAVSTTDHLSADAEGRIYLGSSGCNIPYVAMSDDGGVTWTNVPATTNIRAAFHDVATDTDDAGNVYALWQDDAQGLPYLAVSRDHGGTWSTPVMVAPPDVHATSMLTLTAGSEGRVAVGFVTTTVDNAGDVGRPWSYRIAVTQNALAASPLFISDVATLPDLKTKIVNRGGCCNGMADFLDLQHSPMAGGAAWGTVAATCTTTECLTKRTASSNELRRGLTYAVEQVSGPALVGPARYLPGTPLTQGMSTEPVVEREAARPLPSTGGDETVPGLAVLALTAAMYVARSRRDKRRTTAGGPVV